MSHFDPASEIIQTPSETDKLVAELVSMFGVPPRRQGAIRTNCRKDV